MSRCTFSLWCYHLFLGEPFSNVRLHKIDASPDLLVDDFRQLVVQTLRISAAASTEVELYKPPKTSLEELHATRFSLYDLGKPLIAHEKLAATFDSEPEENFVHIFIFRYDIPMSVWCWIRGTSERLQLDVQMKKTVDTLLYAIKEKSTSLTAPREDLELYKISHGSEEELDKIVRTRRQGELLDKTQNLRDAFYCVGPLTERACVIVEVAEGKRTPLSWDVVERALKQREIEPSSMTASECYGNIQKDVNTRLLDRRLPAGGSEDESLDIPDRKFLAPVELLYEGFGEFLDIYRAHHNSDRVVGSPRDWTRVDMFVDENSLVFNDTSQHRSIALDNLCSLFSFLPLSLPYEDMPYIASGITPFDGLRDFFIGQRTSRMPWLLVQFDSEATPVVQMSLYYERLVKKIAETKPDLLRRSRLPAVGLTIIGPVVTFYAMLYVGSTVYSSLTPSLSCVPYATGGYDRRALHAAFFAACQLLARIDQDAVRLTETDSPHLANHFFPDIDELPSIDDPSVSFKVKISDVLHKGRNHLLYRAESPDRNLRLVIKVTNTYSSELHQFCAERGHAPNLYAVKKAPGNLIIVAMEHLEFDNAWYEGTEAYRKNLGKQLMELVEQFHCAGYVHGDLRLQSLCCVDGKVKLLDFALGGKVGKVFYPLDFLAPQIWEGRNTGNLTITKDDDDRVLKRSLESIGCL